MRRRHRDHGYHLGDRGWWNKVTVFDIGARVPLVIWVPEAGGMRAESEAVVQLLDLYPNRRLDRGRFPISFDLPLEHAG